MAVLDHIHMGSANIYTSIYAMQQEMQIGHYDGGFMSGVTIGHKAFPLGGGVYIEVESVIDPFAVPEDKEPWFVRKAQQFNTEVFSGMCLRVDTMEELADVAKRLGGIVNLKPAQRIRPDGPPVMSFSAPGGPNVPNPWLSGYPNWYCFQDRMYCHPSGQPPVPAPGLKNPMGVAWMEVGGPPEAMKKWLGQSPDDFGMKFNGKAPGLYAIGIKTNAGEVVLRRPSATQTTL